MKTGRNKELADRRDRKDSTGQASTGQDRLGQDSAGQDRLGQERPMCHVPNEVRKEWKKV